MSNKRTIRYYLDMQIDGDTHGDLVRQLSEIPLDDTCRLEIVHASWYGAYQHVAHRGWRILIRFLTRRENDWKSPTYDACERLAQQTLSKSSSGFTAELFTPKVNEQWDDVECDIKTWDRVLFDGGMLPNGRID